MGLFPLIPPVHWFYPPFEAVYPERYQACYGFLGLLNGRVFGAALGLGT